MKSKKFDKQKLEKYLKEMHLSAVKNSYSDITKMAVKESFSYENYLLQLMEEEYNCRKQRRIQRLLKESRLPLEKSLSTFEMKRLPQKNKQQMNQLLKGDFLNNKENVLVFGNPGSGKTHFLSAISQELIYDEHRIYFSKCSLLVQDLLRAKKNLDLAKFIKKLSKYKAIIIDDIGYIQQTRDEMEVLFTFLAERYEQGSVMITSNLTFSKWEKVFKDPVLATAAIDRLIHHCTIVELNLPSYRVNQAKKKGGN